MYKRIIMAMNCWPMKGVGSSSPRPSSPLARKRGRNCRGIVHGQNSRAPLAGMLLVMSASRVLAAAAMLFAGAVRAEQVALSEIMYHPAGTAPEYVEVYNNTATPFDIALWRLTGSVSFAFPD